ncbi:XdhC family protein [Paraferrimonas sedimenticola]|uniref:Xanthine and CO dehydrogenase family maturation factor XdhC/CoxF family protein n=1 Tax=Paraferrimonas sedimenticola TaxID=375674 RepID=A0AA37RXB8_9GAMM|nr:XdhC family protein [Paraferrimonas sedimenticola]GLP96698.1 xanthine and CO dehydrogenase family maturation factor XdhC/CoxF family protein [Paraferrimonas sedimenticola]
MSHRLQDLLTLWTELKDQHQWVLASVIETQGSSYRKPGAMMLINDMGQYFGLVSGGCLESDVMRQARRCWQDGQAREVVYDMREEGDFAWELGIGCGGMVRLWLQPISASNNYLELEELLKVLNRGEPQGYRIKLISHPVSNQLLATSTIASKRLSDDAFEQVLQPRPRLWILGAGVDAIPVIQMAANLGWQVFINDPRVSHGRASGFEQAHWRGQCAIEALAQDFEFNRADAVVVMHHNLQMDAQALGLLVNHNAKFVGQLGPKHRTQELLELADIRLSDFTQGLSNPIGLDLGGDLPEAIALSIVAEIQAVLEGKIAIEPAKRRPELSRAV